MTVGRIERGILKRKGISLGLFLDIAGAYDNLDPGFAVNAMTKRGFDPKMISWYKYYLLNREVTVSLKGISRSRYVSRGVPQGGILSPLIWNIAMDELLQRFDDLDPDDDLLVNGFADDLGLVASGTDQILVFLRVQQALNKVIAWCNEAGLSTEILRYLFHQGCKCFSTTPSQYRWCGYPL